MEQILKTLEEISQNQDTLDKKVMSKIEFLS